MKILWSLKLICKITLWQFDHNKICLAFSSEEKQEIYLHKKYPHTSIGDVAKYAGWICFTELNVIFFKACPHRAMAIYHFPTKLVLNSNVTNFCVPIAYLSVATTSWNFTQGTTMILLYSVEDFKMIGWLEWMLWWMRFHEILLVSQVSVGYTILPQTHETLNLDFSGVSVINAIVG